MIRIGTRASPLALIQAGLVSTALKRVCLDKTIEIVPFTTRADQTMECLADIGGKGLFTKELQDALLTGQIDGAVHSLKDVELHDLPLTFGAFLPREEASDILIAHKSVNVTTIDCVFSLGTCSPRRKAQAKIAFPYAACADLRGNVGTRLKHVQDGHLDAVILACAGLKRLGYGTEAELQLDFPDLVWTELPKSVFVPAAGQGILTVECVPRKKALFAGINDPETERIAQIERLFSSHFGGNCRTALGCYVHKTVDGYVMNAFYEGRYASHILGASLTEIDIQAIIEQLVSSLLTV